MAFPVLRAAVRQASEEEWAWVLKSFQTVIEALDCFLRLAAHFKPFPQLPLWLWLNMLASLATFAIPLGLSLRRNGFGAWIDAALVLLLHAPSEGVLIGGQRPFVGVCP